jgi:hypothetical protein
VTIDENSEQGYITCIFDTHEMYPLPYTDRGATLLFPSPGQQWLAHLVWENMSF